MDFGYNDIELKDAGEADPSDIVTKALDGFRASVDDKLAAVETKARERLDALEARLNRPGAGVAQTTDATTERKAFEGYVRRGIERLSADEAKALTVAVDASAGYLAPEQFVSEILKKLVEFSPIRQYARVMPIGVSEVKFPRRVTGTTATWVGETEDRTASQPSYEQVSMTPHELATFVDVSNALLEDNAYGLESELTTDFAEQFGVAEGTAFVNGDGAGKPKGIMLATGIAEVKTGVAATFPTTNPADVIIGMYHKLPGVFAQAGVWTMNRNTLGEVRKWKDGNGRYLCIEPITAGAPITLLGRPVVEAVDMDDIGANKFPILFGDFSGYRIIDRIGLTMLRDPFTLATKGQVRIHARRRVGADVTHPDRFVKLKIAV